MEEIVGDEDLVETENSDYSGSGSPLVHTGREDVDSWDTVSTGTRVQIPGISVPQATSTNSSINT
jgi:hypothetical protein